MSEWRVSARSQRHQPRSSLTSHRDCELGTLCIGCLTNICVSRVFVLFTSIHEHEGEILVNSLSLRSFSFQRDPRRPSTRKLGIIHTILHSHQPPPAWLP